ncbi:agmatinase [Rhodobacteraceae bacterium 2CG4]|uniref:Agmatinase n=1 Tax=Halovulum marinum TaxID=2662447 RepID=A0A6L5Z3H1_9RHOB|nr:agmatinase [Halovulum marinum]MSU91123.1 agmatinase [Halovulum marinum]
MSERGDQAFRKTDPRGRWAEMGYAGALSFLRRPYSRDAAGADVVVSGLPWDGATSNRPGCRLGPRAIRAASAETAQLNAFPWGFDPFETLRVIDWGDAWIDPHHPQTVAPAIEAHAAAILDAGARMLTLGGDHFVTWPLLKAHAAKHGPLALIQFDAHGDLWEDDPERIDHGTMMGRAIRDGLVDAATSAQVGIRTFHDSDEGLEILTAPFVHREGVAATVQALRARVAGAPVYVSFDIDVLDPAFAPGTGTPVPGGLASWQALEILRGLSGLNLVGLDLVEVSPPYDHAEITAIAAATVAHDWLCLLAEAKGAPRRAVGRL